LKALRASAEAAAAMAKDKKHNVDHNCLCQQVLRKTKPSTILVFWGQE
jgi:hypothetical protein